MYTYTPANSIFEGPVTNPLLILSILIEVLSRTHAEKGKSLNDFKFGSCIGRFPSDDAASMTVKGLNGESRSRTVISQPSRCCTQHFHLHLSHDTGAGAPVLWCT